ncbi:hypothetical protein BCR21_04300 [Enterococcus ureasiticus]|uniref:MucBP domain-containing protein n=1 Tax=Enterococcus ureasiticus TaxID=903984 RepID=A0A1E5GNE0_9ENTE|nr:hypothetical protein BCR21_04300 [Enterococcus ureasiticus]
MKTKKRQVFLICLLLIIGGSYISFSISQIKAEKNVNSKTETKNEKNVKSIADEEWQLITHYEFSKVRLGVSQSLAFTFGGKRDAIEKNPFITDLESIPLRGDGFGAQNATDAWDMLSLPTFYFIDESKDDSVIPTVFDSMFGEGGFEEGRPWTSQSLALIIKGSKFQGQFGFDEQKINHFQQYRKVGSKGSYALKNVYEIENPASTWNPAYRLLVTQIMEYSEKDNLVWVTYEYQNLSKDTLKDVAFGSVLDTYLDQNDSVSVFYLGKKRGLYIESGDYRLDFRFDVTNGMDNWVGSEYNGIFIENFPSVDSTGQETNDESTAAEGMLAAKIKDDSAMAFKTQPVTLKTGESKKAAYGVSVTAVALVPEITLDTKDGTYYGGNHAVSGTWKDIDSESGDIYAVINNKEPIKLNDEGLLNKPKNDVHKWSLDIPEAQLSGTEENKIVIYMVDSDNNRSKEKTFTLQYNRKPILTLVETTGEIDGTSAFNGTLKWSDEDTDELSIYYSVDGGTKQLLNKVTNTNKGIEQTLSYEIPSSALKGTKPNYKVEFWIEDNDKTSDLKELNLTKTNQPIIQTDFSVEKNEIIESESNSYTATIKNTADEPSDWSDVIHETAAFPENVVVDKTTVKLNGVLVPTEKITFDTDRKLKIALDKITPKEELILTYTVTSLEAKPAVTGTVTVTQSYSIKGTSVNKPVEKTSNIQTFMIRSQELQINIQFLEDKTNEKIPSLEPITKKGKSGEKIDIPLEKINGYDFSKVVVDGVERSLVGDILTVEFGKDKEVIFYYFGTLKIKSSPSLFDFGIQTGNVNGMKVDKPDISGSPLVITDTRSTKQKWALKAKFSEPLKSLENEKIIMTDIIKYRNSAEKVTLSDGDNVIFTPENANLGEYNISKDYWSKGEGFLMDFPAGSIKSLGKYHAQITITLENAK